MPTGERAVQCLPVCLMLLYMFSSFHRRHLLALNLPGTLGIFERPKSLCFLSACVGDPGIAQPRPLSTLIPFSLGCFVDSSALFCSICIENKGQLPQQISVKALEKIVEYSFI